MGSSLKNILINELITREGGYVNNPDDSGKETNFGITIAVARENGYTGRMKDLPREIAFKIYEDIYWKPLKLDLIAIISWKLAEEMFDTGVNCGVGTAAKFLQRCLNVSNVRQQLYPDSKVDGVIGSKTIENLRSYFRARENWGGEQVLLNGMNGQQIVYYMECCERGEKNETFWFGWMSKRINL